MGITLNLWPDGRNWRCVGWPDLPDRHHVGNVQGLLPQVRGPMSILTLIRRRCVAPVLAVLLALAGCDMPLSGTGAGLHETTLLGGALKIAAPPGYCIDPKASVARGSAIVVLMGRCTAMGGVAAALVSLTVGAPASAGVLLAGPDVLAKFLTSTAGRRMLSRDGVAGHVVVLQALAAKGALLLHVKDQTAGEYWRAITAIKGRLVTTSASGAEGAPLTSDQGLKLVRGMVEMLDKRNPDTAVLAQGALTTAR